MPRPPSRTQRERFNCELPISIYQNALKTAEDLELDSFTELIRRGLDFYLDFWDKTQKNRPLAVQQAGRRVQIADPQVDRTGPLKRLNLNLASSWHRKVEALAEEQQVTQVVIVSKELLLVQTLKQALQQGGEVGYLINNEFRPVLYEFFLPISRSG